MAEQIFSDSAQQLLVRLQPDTLEYAPTRTKGWRCRLDDLAWTSATMGAHGVEEVLLYSRDGRVAAKVPAFEQIERFYVALLRRLAERPIFNAVRTSLPTRVEPAERVVWLGSSTTAADGAWEALQVEDRGAVVVTKGGLMLVAAQGSSVERIGWEDLEGIVTRAPSSYVAHGSTRFYRARDYVELPYERLTLEVARACRAHVAARATNGARPEGPYRGETARLFSWEIEAARRDDLLEEDETIIAVAFGRGEGSLLPALAEDATAAELEAVPDDDTETPFSRTDLLLTDKRLLRLDREGGAGVVTYQEEVPFRTMPKPMPVGARLRLGGFDLTTDSAQNIDMAGQFMRQYRARARTHRPDPFAPELEEV
jgi:hypothetical protein